jgi:hypothetical protein
MRFQLALEDISEDVDNLIERLIILQYATITQIGQEPTKCTKANGLKMYQGQFWANFRRGDSEKVSEPEADGRPFLAGVDGAPHRPPKYEPSC